MWVGIASAVVKDPGCEIEIALSIHDSVYNTDFASAFIPYDAKDSEKTATAIERYIMQTLKNFSRDNLCKFLGAGVSLTVLKEVRSIFIFITQWVFLLT